MVRSARAAGQAGCEIRRGCYGRVVPKRPVTQLDLAKRLGVTQMTVSHAISGKGRMAPETRERVLALAEQLGYRPNGMARRVQEGRYRGMALLGSASRPAFNVWDQDFHISVGTQLASRSWHLTESWLPGAGLADPAIVGGLLDRLLADVVLVHDVGDQPPVVEALLERHRVPTVWVNAGRDRDAVDFADEDGAAVALRHLLEQGYRRPALTLHASPDDIGPHISVRLRARGWRTACIAAGIPVRILHPPESTDSVGLAAYLREVLAAEDRPDALACYSEKNLILVRIVAAELGLRVGDGIGLLCFGKEFDAVIDRPYTTCALDYPALAHAAVEMGWRRLEQGASQARVLVPLTIVRGGATTSRSG